MHSATETDAAGAESRRASRAVLPSGVGLVGDIGGVHDLRVSGAVDGNVAAEGCVFIAEGATVRGDVLARTVSISGSVTGNVFATAEIVVTALGTVGGELAAPVIDVATTEDGGAVASCHAGCASQSASSRAEPPAPHFPVLLRTQATERALISRRGEPVQD